MMKTAELVDADLDRWAAKAIGKSGDPQLLQLHARFGPGSVPFRPSRKESWAEALMPFARIEVQEDEEEEESGKWLAMIPPHPHLAPRVVASGPTKAIAVTRAFVYWQFGEEVPD